MRKNQNKVKSGNSKKNLWKAHKSSDYNDRKEKTVFTESKYAIEKR